MRLGIIGDLHGNEGWAQYVLDQMGDRKISHAIVLGDFGLWGGLDGHRFLDACQEAAQDNQMSLFAIPGNHENYDILERLQASYPTHKGFTYLRSRVLMCGKVNSFSLGGKKFVVAGGAVSIDKEWRLAKERGGLYTGAFGHEDMGRGSGHRTLWWPQEQLTDEEEEQIKAFGKCDFLLSHDCSNRTPFRGRLKPDADSELHRQRIDRILAAVRPEVHLHGHMHTKYGWPNIVADNHYTQTYGLECDGDYDSWGILETDTGEFAFQGEGMPFRSLTR